MATTAEKGYGRRHQQRREAWVRAVASGLVRCARCNRLILKGQAWDLGHSDTDRSKYTGPEHRHAKDCPAGGNRATHRRRRSRDW